MGKMVIIAHRGGRGPHTENTYEAFKRVVDLGVKAIELDVRMEYHYKRFFLEHDFFHHPKYRKNLLSKAIPLLPKNILYLVELKELIFSKKFVEKFLKLHNEYFRDRPNAVFMSFNPFLLMRLRKMAPDLTRGILIRSYMWHFFFRYFFHHFVKPKYYVVHKRHLSDRNLKWARKQGYKIFTFLLNSEKTWELAITLELDGVITDYPLLMQQFLNKNKHRKYFL